MLICAYTLLSVGQTAAAFGWKDAGEKNRKLDFYILKGIVADPERGGVTLLCICDARAETTATDCVSRRTEVGTTTRTELFVQTPRILGVNVVMFR